MQQLPVPRQLTRFVRWFRMYPDMNAPELAERYRRLPDGATEVIIRFGGGDTSASVVGTRTLPLEKPKTIAASALLIRFQLAGAHPFFGRPLSSMTDQIVPLEEFWPEETRQQLMAASAPSAIAHAAELTLGSLLQRSDAYDPASARSVRRAVRMIEDSAALPSVPHLAVQLGVSERQLRRGFDHIIGLSPKHYLRVVRFRRALRTARSNTTRDWAAIAEQAGYYDQAHLIADFREMSGYTPSALMR